MSLAKVKGELSYPRRIRKRSDIDIMARILEEADRGARKTRIMYRCNLSHRQLQVYLKFLMDMRLLTLVSGEVGNKTNFYKTTTKGRNFLDAYRKLKESMQLWEKPTLKFRSSRSNHMMRALFLRRVFK